MSRVSRTVVDSSALMAVALDEPEGPAVAAALASSTCLMSVATWLEVTIVADSRATALGARIDRIFADADIERVPLTEHHAAIARAAYRRFGRGTGSPARLNLGDCFAYALAVAEGAPLLFVGKDFSETDIARVPLE